MMAFLSTYEGNDVNSKNNNSNNNNNDDDDEGTCFGTQLLSLQLKWVDGQEGTLATPRHKWW